MKISIILSSISIVIFIAFTIVFGFRYEREVEGYLKQAADANSVELAEEKLAKAIRGMDRLGLCPAEDSEKPSVFPTDCYTSVIFRTPDEDVGFWRSNIMSTYEDLHSMTDEERADNLTESNQLIKVRETLLDEGDRGVRVTDPPGISLYPNNALFFAWGWLSFLAFFPAVVTTINRL